MSRSRRLAYIAMTLNALIWGVAFPIVKPALSYISATQYLYLRFLVAGLFALPIFIYYYFKKHPKISYIIKVLLIESLQLLSLPLLYTGLAKTSALEASLIGSTGPLFVVIGSIIFLRERETRREWQGLAISILGSVILILEPLWNGHGFAGSTLGGNLYILLYNILYTAYAVTAKKFYKKSPPLYMGALIYLLAAIIYSVMLLYSDSLPNISLLANSYILKAVAYMALPGSILAFALYLYATGKIEVSETNLFTYLNGVISIPAAYFILGETPSFTSIVAVIIISYGVYRAEFKSTG